MAGFFQQYLGGVIEGATNPPNLRTYQHASKTFTTNGYQNAPKLKFLFHVYFEINDALLGTNAAAFPEAHLPGLLVKNITLPKYNVTLAEMNQYNRKRYVQTKLNYDPVSITFHDDGMNAVKHVWNSFYNYYYNDAGTASANKTTINTRNTYENALGNQQNWGYLGEPSTSAAAGAVGQPKPAFFKSIKIYGFNQHNYSLYTLINPIIERFEHDTYDYSQATGTMENRMTVRYETVTYEDGALNGTNPGAKVMGFGKSEVYDTTLSPIARPGSNATIMGPGGLVDAADGIANDISNGNWLGAAIKATTAAKTVKKMDLSKALTQEVVGVAVSGLNNAASSVVNGRVFPALTGTKTANGSTPSNQSPTATVP
jgi:hypothetical protein